MIYGPIINESTSVIQIQTSSSVVYLSSTTTPGQMVTVVDATGFVSSPQKILISTVGTSAPPLFIQQRFGYVTLVSENNNTWTPVNCNSFPTTSSVYYKSADITEIHTSTLYSRNYISGINGVTDSAEVFRSSFFKHGYINTLNLNDYRRYLSSVPFNEPFNAISRMKLVGSTFMTDRYSISSGISSIGDIFAGVNVSSKNGTISIGGNLSILGSYRGQRGKTASLNALSSLSSASFANPVNIISSTYANGPVHAPSLASYSLAGQALNVTSSIVLGNGSQAIQYSRDYLTFLNTSLTLPFINAENITSSNAITTASISVGRFDPSNTIDNLTTSSASIVNPGGSLITSTIDGRYYSGLRTLRMDTLSSDETLRTSTLYLKSLLSATTLQGQSATLSTNSATISSATTSALFAVNRNVGNLNIVNLTVNSSILFSSATLFNIPNADINTIGGRCVTGTMEIASSLTGNSYSMNIISSPSTVSFRGQGTASMSSLRSQTVAGQFLTTSSIVTGNASFGDLIQYSTVRPYTPWIESSTFNMNTGPFMKSVGLGTFYEPLRFTAVSDETAYYSLVDPGAQFPSQLSTTYVNALIGNGIPGETGDGGIASNAELGKVISPVAVDKNNKIYFGDANINWKVRSIPSTGMVTSIAGAYQYYYGNSVPANQAAMGPALAISVAGPGGAMYVTDISNQVIRYVDTEPFIYTVAGTPYTPGYSGDGGPPLQATFSNPTMTALDTAGNLFIADTGNNVIRQYSTSVYTYAGTGVRGATGDDGPASEATFAGPYGLALDLSQNMFITDLSNNVIRTIDKLTSTVQLYAGSYVNGFAGDGGPAISARLSYPRGIAVDSLSNVYVCDTGNSRVRRIDAEAGTISTIAGNGVEAFSGNSGQGHLTSLSTPTGVATDANGNLYIADKNNNCIRFLNTTTGAMQTIAGLPPNAGYNGDNIFALTAYLSSPSHLVLDFNSGFLYFSDEGNARIRFVDTNTGILYNHAGNGSPAADVDNVPGSNALFQSITGLVADRQNNVYISDGQGAIIRKYDINTRFVSTVVGTGQAGYGEDASGLKVAINFPTGLISDSNNNVLFCDSRNHLIRTYSSTLQTVRTICGTGFPGYSGDGGYAYLAELNFPQCQAIDMIGNLYIGDTSNYVIRRVDTEGIITTYAGTGSPGSILPGEYALTSPLSVVTSMVTDSNGQLYFTDLSSNTLWTVDSNLNLQALNTVSTPSYLGDGGPLSNAQFNMPLGVTFDMSYNFIISDAGNYRLRKSYTYGIPQNPIYLNMNMQFTNYQAETGTTTIDINGNPIATFTSTSVNSTVSLQDVNVYSFPLQTSNPIFGDHTPYIKITQTGNTGYLKLDGSFWIESVPGVSLRENLLTASKGITVNSGYLTFPNAMNAITIQNELNDASTRTLFYNGSLNSASDPALKENIESANLSLCYESLGSIPLRTYNYIPAYESTFGLKDTTRLGFITQEVAAYFPKAVSKTPFEHWASTIETLDVTQIKYTHLGATQKLIHEVSTMEAHLAELVKMRDSLRLLATQRNVMH